MYKNERRNIERISHNGKIIEGSKKVTTIINDFFKNKVEKIINDMKDPIIDPMKNFKKAVKTPKIKLKFQQINMSRIKKIITHMSNGNSFSRDLLTGKLIKKM